jgi:hypothetical protein
VNIYRVDLRAAGWFVFRAGAALAIWTNQENYPPFTKTGNRYHSMLPSEDETVIQKNIRARQTTNWRVAHMRADHSPRVNVSAGAYEIAASLVCARRNEVDLRWGENSTQKLPPTYHLMHDSGHLFFRSRLSPHLRSNRSTQGESCTPPQGQFHTLIHTVAGARDRVAATITTQLAQMLGFGIPTAGAGRSLI